MKNKEKFTAANTSSTDGCCTPVVCYPPHLPVIKAQEEK